METCIKNEPDGYVVMAYVPEKYDQTILRFKPVVKMAFQSDAIEVRDFIEQDSMNPRRLSLLIDNYRGQPMKMRSIGTLGPNLAPYHEE